jgi:hypothetical protein
MSELQEARDRHQVLIESVPHAEGWRTMEKVILHHAPVSAQWAGDAFVGCRGCDAGMYAEALPAWPCSTIRLIAADYNVILPAA